jgi:hypothetical protein
VKTTSQRTGYTMNSNTSTTLRDQKRSDQG